MARPLLAILGLAALVAGAWSGLARASVPVHPPGAVVVAAHGALMVGGALGTVISLERAVALGQSWAYAAPVASGLSGLAAIFGAPWFVVTWGFALASALFVAANVGVLARQTASFTGVMALGACAWLAGNVAWAIGSPVHRLVLFWVAFLVLTIAGERLELSRLRRPPRRAVVSFVAIVWALLTGCAVALGSAKLGAQVAGTSLVAMAVWLTRYDVARSTVRQPGLPRFVAVCLLIGFGWLMTGGGLLVIGGELVPGLWYDAVLHSLFLGFVFSMIFGHAPIILPAVLGVRVVHSRALYVALGLLQLSVALRVVSDVAGAGQLRGSAAVGNVAALPLYAIIMIAAKVRAVAYTQARSTVR